MNWLFAAILVLQVTGVWGWISPGDRANLATLALGHSAIGAVARAAAVAPTLSRLALPVRAAAVGGATGEPVTAAAAPTLTEGTAAYALDVDSGTVLYAAGAAAERPIASTTKLMTALVILGAHDPNERVTIPTLPAYPSDAELVGLNPGETYSIIDLAQLMLVASDNDAADSLAIIDSGNVTAFTAKMNTKAAEWGITGAHFGSASGLIDAGNTVSAEALAHIALLALHNPLIRETVLKPSVSVTSGGGRKIIQNTTDTLLATGQFYGIKTGYTGAAGQCFVGLTKISGHEVITVVLGSGDRFGDTQLLTSWISQSYQWF